MSDFAILITAEAGAFIFASSVVVWEVIRGDLTVTWRMPAFRKPKTEAKP